MSAIEQHNLQQIEDLNQRGGRTLSIVDLIEANTVSLEMAAYLLCKVSEGASFLTAARPGGAGKTTLMACLLSFLKPGVRIVTVSDSSVLQTAPAKAGERLCYLAHELGHGHHYGYISNAEDVSRFLSLRQEGHIVASCLHADTLPELTSILVKDLRVPASALAAVDLLLFIHVDRGIGGSRRRVATVYEGGHAGQGHALVYQREPSSDTFSATAELAVPGRWGAAKELLTALARKGVREFAQVREEIAGFLRE